MSSYLVVLCTNRREQVHAWIAERSDPRDMAQIRLPGASLFIVASDVRRHLRDRSFMIGTVVDPQVGIGFGQDGWDALVTRAAQTEIATGEFVRVTWTGAEVEVDRDLFGTIPLLTTQGDGIAAASDSLLVLRDLRDAMGWSSTVNVEAATARTRTLAVTHQQMSTETMIEEISFVPAGHGVRLSSPLWRRDVRLTRTGPGLPTRAKRLGGSRTEVTRRIAANSAALVGALVRSPDVVPSLALSGGVDSRMMLAAARCIGALDELVIESWNDSAANVDDYACAVALSERYGFALNDADRFDLGRSTPLAFSAYGVFASTHLGVYDRVLPVSGVSTAPRRIRFDGLGAELVKGNYTFRSMERMRHWLKTESPDRSDHAGPRFDAAVRQLDKGIATLDVDPAAPDSTEWHYAAYRAGLHGGAHIGLALSGLRPLQQLELMALGHLPDDADSATPTFTRAAQGMTDLLLVLDPDLAAQPYAPPTVPAPEHERRQRLAELGGPMDPDEVPVLQVHGKRDDAGGGPHSLGLAIADAWGLSPLGDNVDVVSLTQPWVDAIADPTLRAIHGDLGRLTSNEMRKVGGRAAYAGPGPAKRLTAALLAQR